MDDLNKTREEMIEELKALRGEVSTGRERIRRLLSQLKTVRSLHEILLRVDNLDAFFQDICEVLAELEGFKCVWIGRIQSGSYDVRPVACAGEGKECLAMVKITWDDSLYGKGAVGQAIRSGKICKVADTENDPSYEAWREEAMRRGYYSSIALPLRVDEEILGVLQVFSEEKDDFGLEEMDFLTEICRDISIGVRSFSLENELQQKLDHVRKTLGKTVESITRMTEIRDAYTSGHQQRVAKLACAIARDMGLSAHQIEGIRVAGLLHDIGKIAVPIEILTKPGRLSVFEFNIIKTHPEIGYEIVKGIDFPWPVAQGLLQHHERLNGSGYPLGVAGEKICLEAKILGVADVVEAMSSHRPYRPALGTAKALGEVLQKKDTLYDPHVVDSCVRIFKEQDFDFNR